MSSFALEAFSQLMASYGYWAVFGIVALESSGIPLPGETALISAAIYAGTTHEIAIPLVIAAAVCGAVLGDNLGFWVGRQFGLNALLRYGSYINMTQPRLKLGQYLFLRHGGKIVFFGRFVAVLRTFAALLAGVNRMDWRRFLIFNILGGATWASIFGLGGYLLGETVHRYAGPAGMVALVVAVAAVILTGRFLKHHEKRLEAEAERVLPGPLIPRHHHKI